MLKRWLFILHILFMGRGAAGQLVKITNVVILPQAITEDTSRILYPVNGKITLSNKRNSFLINFSPSQPVDLFAFRLKGVLLHEINTRNKFAFFNHLPAGEYTFTVRAIDKPSWPTTQLKLIVESPIWLRWWFLPLLFLYGIMLFGVGFYFLYRYRIRQLLHLQAVRENIARDLHDDIGSYLGSISILSQSVVNLSRKDPQKAQELVQKIGETARHVMDSMGEIIWSVNPENDSMAQIVTHMQDVGNDLLNEQTVIFTLDLDDATLQTHLPLEKRRDFFLIYKEALHNIVKYAQARHIWVRIERQQSGLLLTIQDDGIGFNQSQSYSLNPLGGNGLKNMRQRAEKMGAIFTISSQPGQGTTLMLQIILF